MANRYNATFRTREDIFDSITPNLRVQPNIVAPHGKGDWKPARWLPVVWTASNYMAGSDAFVISQGKVVAQDAEDSLVPAGLRGAFAAPATTDVVLTYTATDVSWGVYDLTTGLVLTAPVSYTALQVAVALVNRGLVDRAAAPTTAGHVAEVIEAFISLPVGFAAYDFYVFAGRPEDGNQTFTNYNKQHAVQFLTEGELSLPYMAGDTVGTDSFITGSITLSNAPTSGQRPADGNVLSATGAATLAVWDPDDIGDVVVLVLDERDIAAHTSRTPIAADDATVLIRQKGSIADVTRAGDWYLHAKAGFLVIHRDTWDALVTATTTVAFTYYYYSSSAVAASERYTYFSGVPNFGSRLVSVDSASNFCPKGAASDILASTDPALGKLHRFDQEPKDLLQHVKTAWALDNLSAASKMPGSATQGFSHKITLAEEKVADSLVVINVRI